MRGRKLKKSKLGEKSSKGKERLKEQLKKINLFAADKLELVWKNIGLVWYTFSVICQQHYIILFT